MSLGSKFLLIVCSFGVFLDTVAAKSLPLPPFIKACSRNDPKLNECAVKHGREALPYVVQGNPQVKIPPLDPLFIPEVRVDQTGSGGGAVGAVLTSRDITVTGLKDTIFERANLDLKNRRVDSWYTIPRLEIISKYEIKGRILVLPIEGKGDANFTLVGNKLYHWFTYDLVQRDGETFTSLTGEDLTVNASRAYFHLTNLFNGDKLLGDNMNKFLNDNWNDVLQEIGPDIVVAVRKIMEVLVRGVMNAFSYDTIFPEKV
ncbi:protein takeout [Anabrus simplex]|uniref:protein takeout n=1 Tax=Anabrus simplex TaxID=316456 RepID=UPI0035A3A39D